MKDIKESIIALLIVLGAIILIALIIALPVMWLWNWLMPDIFGLIKINFYQSLGLVILFNMLFNASSSKDK